MGIFLCSEYVLIVLFNIYSDKFEQNSNILCSKFEKCLLIIKILSVKVDMELFEVMRKLILLT